MSVFCCPICGSVFAQETPAFRCNNGHSFDRAGEGYVHLLPSNRMHAKIPGDNKEMVVSRRRFLEAGFYAPFAKEIASLVCQATKNLPCPVIVDAGCGEGYYTAAIADHLTRETRDFLLSGFDISKFAVKLAAKRKQAIEWAVASIFSIPIPDRSVDCVISIFAPIVPEEFARLLKPGGTLLLAVPTPQHLFGLKRCLYDAPYENERKDTDYEGFSFEKRVTVELSANIPTQQLIADLFSMTPYYWKTPVAGVERLKNCDSLTTQLGFDLLVYHRQ